MLAPDHEEPGLLENYFLPGHLERAIDYFVEHYSHHRRHESLKNLTPADVYAGRGTVILKRRAEIKCRTIQQAAYNIFPRPRKLTHAVG